MSDVASQTLGGLAPSVGRSDLVALWLTVSCRGRAGRSLDADRDLRETDESRGCRSGPRGGLWGVSPRTCWKRRIRWSRIWHGEESSCKRVKQLLQTVGASRRATSLRAGSSSARSVGSTIPRVYLVRQAHSSSQRAVVKLAREPAARQRLEWEGGPPRGRASRVGPRCSGRGRSRRASWPRHGVGGGVSVSSASQRALVLWRPGAEASSWRS